MTHSDPQFLTALKNNNKITKRTFSFYINKLGYASFIDIGEPQTSNMKGGSSAMKYIPTNPDDYFWSAYNQGIAFGNTVNKTNSFAYGVDDGDEYDEIVDGATYSIFDSSMPFILISDRHFDSFLAKLFEQVGGYDYNITDGVGVLSNGILMTRCDYNFPTLYFMFNNMWIKLNKEDYYYDSSEAQDGSVCILKFMQNSESFNIFGLPIFAGYYVTFDADEH